MERKNVEERFRKITLENLIEKYGLEKGQEVYQQIENGRSDYSRENDMFGNMFTNENVEEVYLSVYGNNLGSQKFDSFVDKYTKVTELLSEINVNNVVTYNREFLNFINYMNIKDTSNVFTMAARIRELTGNNGEKTDVQRISANLQKILLNSDLERELRTEGTMFAREAIQMFSEIVVEAERIRFFAIKGLSEEKIEEFRNKKIADFKENLNKVQTTINDTGLYNDGKGNSAFLRSVSKGTSFGIDPLQVATRNLSNSNDLFQLNGLKNALEERISLFEKASTEELREFMTSFYLQQDLIEKYNNEFAEISKETEKEIEEAKENLAQAEKEMPQESVSITNVDNKKEEQEPKQAESVQSIDKAREELERKKEMLKAFQKFQREFTQEQRNFIINQYMNQMLIQEQHQNMENNGPKLS